MHIKTIVLDIHIKLNNNSYINLEMQVINKHDWIDRSLFYLCRTFGQLEKGDENAQLSDENKILRSVLTDKDAQIAFLNAKLAENNLLN